MNARRAAKRQRASEDLKDLGFGSRVAQQSRLRLLNRDGSFNVARNGLSYFQSLHLYHSLLSMSWPVFFATISFIYIVTNMIFALLFLACGAGQIQGSIGMSEFSTYWQAFFLSVHTFTTLGYGNLLPHGLAANLVATVDSFVGLILFASATGLVFARFSKPTAKILFSEKAIFAPYQDRVAFEFRLANARSNQLIEVELKVLLSKKVGKSQDTKRRFSELKLVREKVSLFPLHLTAVHPIDDKSPLAGQTLQDLEQVDAEFIVLVSAFDETFAQTVHTRTSYKCDELVWGAKFTDMFRYPDSGVIAVDLRLIHGYEDADLPS